MGGEQVGYVTSVAEDLNSGPSAYTSSVLFYFMFVILDILPQELKRDFSRGYRQLICTYYSETSIMRIYCLSYGNGQKTRNLFCNITVKRLAEKQYVVRLISKTQQQDRTRRVKLKNKKVSDKKNN